MTNVAGRAFQIVIALALFMSTIASSGAFITAQAGALEDTAGGPSLMTHLPIRINNDAELASTASSGTGTVDDPYVIENLDIDAAGAGNAIFVGNTSALLVIRDCYLHNASIGSTPNNAGGGVSLYNVTNARVENNTCRENIRGIYLYSSSNNYLGNNTGTSNSFHGIGLYFSSNNHIEMNNCSENGMDGIHIEDSVGNTVDNNVCARNDRYGILLTGSSNNVIDNNACTGNKIDGIRLFDLSDHNIMINNKCSGNIQFGIHLSGCNGNKLFGNVLTSNNGATPVYNASYVQAYDNGVNIWNASSYGNYWSDWTTPATNHDGIVDSPYIIAGGSNKDYLPLTTAPTLPYVTINAPVGGSVVRTPTVLVTGTANPYCDLEVNGVLVHVKQNGSFSVTIAVPEGASAIEAMSFTLHLNASDSVVVTYVNKVPAMAEEIKNLQDNDTELQVEVDVANGRIDEVYNALNGTIDSLASAIEHIKAVNDVLNATDAKLNLTSEQLAAAIAYLSQISDRGNETALDLEEAKELLSLTGEWMSSINEQLVASYDAQNATAREVASLIDQTSSVKASLIDMRDSLNQMDTLLNLTDDELATLTSDLDAAIADLSAVEMNMTTVQTNLKITESDVSTLRSDSLPPIMGAAGLFLGILAIALVVFTRYRKAP